MTSFQLDGGLELGSGLLIGLGCVDQAAKCLETADSTMAIRWTSSSVEALPSGFVLPACVDGLYFFILAATCCETSIEICLDLPGPPVTRAFLACGGFLACVGLCASGLFCHHSLSSRR